MRNAQRAAAARDTRAAGGRPLANEADTNAPEGANNARRPVANGVDPIAHEGANETKLVDVPDADTNNIDKPEPNPCD